MFLFPNNLAIFFLGGGGVRATVMGTRTWNNALLQSMVRPKEPPAEAAIQGSKL